MIKYYLKTALKFVVLPIIIFAIPCQLFSQDEEDEEGIFWDEEGEYYEDEYYDEEDTTYYEDEDTSYYEDEEYYDEGDEDFLDEEYGDEYLYGDEEEEDLSDLEFVEEAKREGFTLQITFASPGYVNHTLDNWNSSVDFRASVDFPFLLQIGSIKFRFGIEIASYSFENSLPVGGRFSGVGFLGMLSFPAGPSTVQFGAGVMGSSPSVVASQSFGFSIGNLLDIRAGVRSTMAFNPPNIFEEGATNASWLDGFVAVGYTL